MAGTKASTGRGTVLSIGSGGTGETYLPILQVKTWQPSGQQWKFDDVTNGNSPVAGAGVLEEAIPATLSAGTWAIGGVFLPTDPGQLALATAFANGTLADFQLQLPASAAQPTKGNLYAFSAYVQDMPLPDLQFDKAQTFKCTLKINTLITVTAGS
jgi:hypothetical protein